jgi:uncharacterized protein (TIGR02001 family)
MRKSVLGATFAVAFAVPSIVMAQTPPPSPLTANVTLASEYRFRGIDQTFGEPALQGGVDYAHASGLYVGNWNSNVNSGAGFPHGNLEMDLYGGWKKAFGDFGLDVGAIYYMYPGTDPKIDNKEIYVGGTWKMVSLKYFHSLGDYFDVPDTKGSKYFDLAATFDLGSGWGVIGHFGVFKMKNLSIADYEDWKVGVTKDIGGWVFGAAYVDTNAEGDCAAGEFYCFSNSLSASGSGSRTRDAGKATVVLSVTKTF